MIGDLPIIGRAWSPSDAPPPALSDEFRPAFARYVRRPANGRRDLVAAPPGAPMTTEPWEVITLGGEAADGAWEVVQRIDGVRSLRDIAADAAFDVHEVIAFVQTLYHGALVRNAGGAQVPASAFYEHLRSRTKYAFLEWGVSPLLRQFAVGPVSRRLALGYLVETYHFASAVASHEAAAIASMPSLRLKTAFSEHLSQEYWHYAWLRGGLLAGGLSEAELLCATPLPSTLGPINQLRWLAVTDPLAYSACIGITEARPGLRDSFQRFWTRFAELGVLPEEVYAPFREHDLVDCDDNHESFGSEAFGESGPLTAAEQDRIAERVLTYSYLTSRHHHALLEFYGSGDGPSYFSFEDLREAEGR
jgi:pyrroloquinoline quinone (PQQ) biosynthesis protein C